MGKSLLYKVYGIGHENNVFLGLLYSHDRDILQFQLSNKFLFENSLLEKYIFKHTFNEL